MISKLMALAAAGAMLTVVPAWAGDDAPARLAGLKGQVMVSRDGRITAAAPGSLRTGDRVISRAGGQAEIRFADGCVVALKPSSMLTVAAASPCAAGRGVVAASVPTAMQDDDGNDAVKAFTIWIVASLIINELIAGDNSVSP